ncbi:MAG: YkgJ family cysteine cluster protein [candidate division Zixibacteria bacterium]|nr:YkgJ family cysteine cluster protein [candidate division Zixibacteria bacterium]MBU1470745.1 YkgJ family cysteine cluster protein [candidate division Zixibacteria bacterium]MBU2624495.1 YkgJ family cysteine cluster protein [candidate division Zixibacteria bacterium]
MKEIENLKKAILDEYPRLAQDSSFTFRCHKGVSCFNDCCGDVNIFLTPYDIIRLKNRLGIASGELIAKHTISPFDENLRYPVVMLKMQDNEKKSCPFVSEQGCTVYEDRPWSCRMYPLGLASPKDGSDELDKEFYFLLQEGVCKGFQEKRKQTVSDWIKDQGIAEYNELGDLFKDIALHEGLQKDGGMTPEKIEMFFMVAYDIDKFHNFIFKSTFLDKFEVDDETRQKIEKDDVELLKFGFNWLRFSLFGEKTMTVKQDVLHAKQSELEAKMSQKKTE